MPKDTLFSKKRTINCNGRLLDISSPKIMGILNITPDSFYDGGKFFEPGAALKHADLMFEEGADIIDIGAFSSRPGAKIISEKEELKRLVGILKLVRDKYPDRIISVDTFRAEVAKVVVSDFKADIINDISAGTFDKKMIPAIANLHVSYIMMHMQGTPANMQKNPVYTDVVEELIDFFVERIHKATQQGIKDIILDPGFGFGKTIEHNYQLLKNLDQFQIFEIPILAGISRKSMISKVLGSTPESSLNGTIALNLTALLGGADILRVHDVKEAVEVIRLYTKLNETA